MQPVSKIYLLLILAMIVQSSVCCLLLQHEEMITCSLRSAKALFPDVEIPADMTDDTLCSIPLSVVKHQRLKTGIGIDRSSVRLYSRLFHRPTVDAA